MKPLEVSAAPLRRLVYQMATGRRDTKEWDLAWEHIKEHLSIGVGNEKEKHGVFDPEFRTKAAIADLVAQTASKPSSWEESRLTVGADPVGAPCLIIRRWFNRPLGIEYGKRGSGKTLETLWIIVRHDGRLVTAFPGPGK